MLTGQSNSVNAGPEVLASPKRRRISVQDKRRLVREYEATPNGERGAFLRLSYIDNWRKLVESASIQALVPQKRGPKPQPKPDPELERLQRENAFLKVKLSRAERAQVLEILNSERFVDQSPAQVSATLMEEGKYLCSLRSMYRILAAHHQTRERRNQLRHPSYTKPELLATGPNELWSWDITKLKGPVKWNYFYLYVILDVLVVTLLAGCWPIARVLDSPSV